MRAGVEKEQQQTALMRMGVEKYTGMSVPVRARPEKYTGMSAPVRPEVKEYNIYRQQCARESRKSSKRAAGVEKYNVY